MPQIIRVVGEATSTSQPDQAQIMIGVVTHAATAQEAAAQNAEKTDRLIAQLRKMVGSSGSIRTINYALNPNYQYPREGGEPTINGYIASNMVQAQTTDLAQVGKLIDAATGAGANNIEGLQFMLKDAGAAQTQALQTAATNARAKANAIASSLGLRVGRILSVEEEGAPVVRPVMAYRREAMNDQATTPVEPGTIDVRASVVMTVEVGP
jgi:uncharacterized protein YggE